MILSICPNPSIDCTIELDSLNVGMLNRTRNKIETYSGKALNVAKGVARFGEKSFATGFMFEDHGKLFEYVLEKEGVEYKFVYNVGGARVNYKIIDKKSMLTEINDRGETVGREKQTELLELIKKLSEECDIAVVSGSLPKGVEPSFYNEMLSVIPDRVKKVVDAETENMDAALSGRKIFMVKPNLRELIAFTGKDVKTKEDMVKAASKYLDRGVENVLISLGADGAVFTDGKQALYCKSMNVTVNSTVGAGDCMIAAAVVGVSQGRPPEEFFKMSVAAGTASITTRGTNLFYKDKYDEIYAKIFVEKLNA